MIKQTSGASLALDEDSPYTNSIMFVYIRSAAFVIVVLHKLVLQQSKNSQLSVRKPYRPLLLFNSPCIYYTICFSCMQGNHARKVILEVYAFFVLQRTVFGWKK